MVEAFASYSDEIIRANRHYLSIGESSKLMNISSSKGFPSVIFGRYITK